MSGDKRAILRQRIESGELRLQPLTYPQRELWENSPIPPGDIANHICCLIEVRGNVAPQDGAGALEAVVGRQEALRVSFLPGKDGPLQMIRRDGLVSFRARDLPPEQNHEEGVEEAAREIFHQPFDLLQGPLYRVELLRRAPDHHVLVFAIHHSIADGWTLGVFVQELVLGYFQRARGVKDPLPSVPLTYTAWGAAERAFWQPTELAPRIAFWKTHLAGYQRLWNGLEGPATAAGPHTRLVAHFPAELARAVRELARRSSATLFSTLLTAFQVALSRWTKSNDILVGTPVANRSKQNSKETMGYFAGVVPIRGKVDAQETFSSSLRRMHQTSMDCFANAVPFAELAKALNDPATPGHPPIFEVRFALQNHPIPDVALPGLSAKLRMRSTGTARFHLACEVTEEGEQLEVVWLFRPQLFPQADLENLRRMFQEILSAASRSPETEIAALS